VPGCLTEDAPKTALQIPRTTEADSSRENGQETKTLDSLESLVDAYDSVYSYELNDRFAFATSVDRPSGE
jgi:hypothetical protein